MKIKKHIRIPIMILIAFALIAFIFFVLWRQEAHAPIFENKIANEKSAEISTTSDSTKPVTPAKPTASESLQNVQIPILMYHYVRTVDDPTDTAGITLSVTPERFAQQLDLIADRGYTTTTLEAISQGKIPDKPIILTFDDGYEDFYTNAYPALKARGMTAILYVIVDKNSSQYMSQNQILEISQNNIEIGSHTLSHPNLIVMSIEEATNEITQSKTKIEEIIGKKVTSFCYPSGRYNDQISEIVKNSGYLFAVTTNSGMAKFNSVFDLQRYRINADTNVSAYLK